MSNLPNKKFYIKDQSWAEELETGVVEYTDALLSSTMFEDEESEPMATLSGEVFCGCDTCFWREALFFITPRIIEGYKTGKVVLNED